MMRSTIGESVQRLIGNVASMEIGDHCSQTKPKHLGFADTRYYNCPTVVAVGLPTITKYKRENWPIPTSTKYKRENFAVLVFGGICFWTCTKREAHNQPFRPSAGKPGVQCLGIGSSNPGKGSSVLDQGGS